MQEHEKLINTSDPKKPEPMKSKNGNDVEGQDLDLDARLEAGSRDPRLEIPEILRTPVEHPSLKPKKPSGVATNLGEVGTALAIAIDFLATAGAGALIGWGIDAWRGSLPVGVLIGAAVGFLVGTFRLLVRLSKGG